MLSGSLDTFTVGQILSLIGASETTGALRVRTEGDEGMVYCHNGAVTFATVGPSAELGDILVRAGLVSEDRWIAVERADTPANALSELLDDSDVDMDRVSRFILGQVEETVFELDRWTSGDVRLEVDVIHALSDHINYPTVDLLGVLDERRSVWVELLGKIGSVDRVVHQAPVASDDNDEMSISRKELMVVSHVDGTRSISELARYLGTGLYRTGQIIGNLVDAGLVVLSADRSAGTAAGTETPPAPAPAHERSLVPATAGAAQAESAGSGADTTDEPPVAPPGSTAAEFVEPGSGPAQDLILRLLSAVKEEL